MEQIQHTGNKAFCEAKIIIVRMSFVCMTNARMEFELKFFLLPIVYFCIRCPLKQLGMEMKNAFSLNIGVFTVGAHNETVHVLGRTLAEHERTCLTQQKLELKQSLF